MSIEGIALEHFSAATHPGMVSGPESWICRAVFHVFLSNYIKQDADTTAAHRKHRILLSKQQEMLISKLNTL